MNIAHAFETYDIVPVGQLRSKLKNTVYQRIGNELVKTKDYLDVGEEVMHFGITNSIADLGKGYFVKEVNSVHFDMSCGLLTVLGENVKACSRNGIELRAVHKGKTFTVLNVIKQAHGLPIYQINGKEFLSSAQAVQFIQGYFIPEIDLKLDSENNLKKGERYAYKNVEGSMIQLMDNTWLDVSINKGKMEGYKTRRFL